MFCGIMDAVDFWRVIDINCLAITLFVEIPGRCHGCQFLEPDAGLLSNDPRNKCDSLVAPAGISRAGVVLVAEEFVSYPGVHGGMMMRL